jgi:hypothetical protein
MVSKQEIAQTIKEQFANVKERGRVLAQALKARADIAATRRRLRATFADLGEAAYEKMAAGKAGDLSNDAEMADFRARVEGLKAELKQREKALKEIMEAEVKKGRKGQEEEKATTGE